LVAFGFIMVGLVHPFVPVSPVALRSVGGGSILPPRASTATMLKATDAATDVKQELLACLAKLNTDELRIPCGLECTDNERDQIAKLIADLEQDPRNLVLSRNRGTIEAKELLGEWELLYTSSRTMAINKSLSGLGRSTSDLARFSGLRQELTGSK
jgi:hypothetical protein